MLGLDSRLEGSIASRLCRTEGIPCEIAVAVVKARVAADVTIIWPTIWRLAQV